MAAGISEQMAAAVGMLHHVLAFYWTLSNLWRPAMINELEALIASAIADFFAGVVEIHTELGGPNTVEEAQQQMTERVVSIALEAEETMTREIVAKSAALEHAQLRIAELEAAAVKPVKLPEGYVIRAGHPIYGDEKNVMIPKEGGNWLSRFDVEHAIRTAGGSVVEGE
jgi:hypothetical protein